MKVEAVTPGDYLGDVTGDLNRRRGIIQGMEETVVGNIIKLRFRSLKCLDMLQT